MNKISMNSQNPIKWGLIGLISIFCNGCATGILEAVQGKAPIKDKVTITEKVFSDQIISYGIPSAPIPNHEYAIAMAGKHYSYLIEPSNTKEPTLFHNFFKHVDTRYLAFTTKNKSLDVGATQAKSSQQLAFTIHNNQVKDLLSFVFIKPISELKKNELQNMQKYRFQCEQKKLPNQIDYLICKQTVDVQLTVTTKAQNSHQLRHQFRDPLIFDFYQETEKNKYNVKKAFLMPLAPVTIAFDIVTFPVLLGFAALGLEGPASTALGTLF